jgi:hypothetical protein
MKRLKDFSEETKVRCLLWSDRHCCLCEKVCGTDIEVAHIDPNGGNDLDNAIPLCYQCHAAIGKYNPKHPRGIKYKIAELKARREQIYEKYTRQLVPPVQFNVMPTYENKGAISLPRVGFTISHLGDRNPVNAKINVRVFLGDKEIPLSGNPKKPYYSGGIVWNLNSRQYFIGNFNVPNECVDSSQDLRLEVQVTIIDPYKRYHELLPVCFSYVRDEKYWFLEPTSSGELQRFMNQSTD